jgi:type IV pilus assembly protein PilC
MAFLDQVTTQKALQICAKRCRNERYATAILGVAHDFVNGVPLDEALARRPKEFSAIEVAMVRAGQRASEMKSTYSNIGQMLQNLYETETACWDALRGPGILSFFAVGGIWFMLAWFVPQMASLLSAVGGKMPAPTMFVLWLSGVAINPLVWLASAGLLVGAIWLWRWLMHDPSFALRVGNGIASIPKIGSLVQQFMTARVARALSVTGRALAAGKAVELIIPLARWRRYRMALEQIAKSIRDGREIEEAFAETNVFDPMLVQYLETGREAAALDAACERVADFLEREVQRSLKALTELIEPILTAVISAVFTVVVLALYLPYLDMLNDAMKMTNGVQ